MGERPDNVWELLVNAIFEGKLIPLACDEHGNMLALMQGVHNTDLTTIQTDEDGNMRAILMGMYGLTATPIAVDVDGKVIFKIMEQTAIGPDGVESTAWTMPIASLLSNMNRIRNQIVAITGEAWGTVTHSLTDIWAKFHAATGHQHTGAADDAPQIDHGTTTDRDHDDHDQYLNTARHDVTARHTLGSVVPHDSFDNVTGRWTLAQAHRGTDDYIMVFQGAGADPIEEAKPAGRTIAEMMVYGG